MNGGCKTCGSKISHTEKFYNWEYSYCSYECWENSVEAKNAVMVYGNMKCPNGKEHRVKCLEMFLHNEELLELVVKKLKESIDEDECVFYKEGERD